MLHISDLHASVGKKLLLRDLQLQLQSGNCIGIIGANGAGKSSLLKAIGQDLRYQGTICWQRQNLTQLSPKQLAEQVVFLPQHSNLNFAFQVQEIVEMGLINPLLSKTEETTILQQAIADFDLTHLQQHNYLHLSGGEKQRVHSARIWAQINSSDTRKIVLLDEPTSALDLKHQHVFLQLAQKLAAEKHLVILVLHDLNLAARYCNQLLLLHQGQILDYGDTTAMLTAKNIAILYDYQTEVYRHQNQLRVL